MTAKPRILAWDIETFPDQVFSWGLWVNGMLDSENIVQERTIICGSWKWVGEREVHHVVVDPSTPLNDKAVVEKLHEIVSSADAIVHHNGDKFDIKWLKARAVYYGLPPIPPVIQIDTKKIAKAQFYFNSNKLAYLAQFLGIGAKIHTDFRLWKKCYAGDPKALDRMVRYNRRDVRLLEKVYHRLEPWIKSKLNQVLWHDRTVCEHCGGPVQYRGFYYTHSQKYRRFQCIKDGCGKWGRELKPYKETN